MYAVDDLGEERAMVQTEIDPNKIVADTATALAKDFITGLTNSVTKKVSRKYAQYFSNFSGYLERVYTTCSTVKTIINKESPALIDDIYVKARFKCGKELVDDDSLCQHIRDGRRVVVTGFGGIGKTIFCKYLFLSVFRNPAGRIPIFFELRRVNDITQKNLTAFLRVSSSADDEIVSEEVFRAMMADGRFIFILDGFDEIPDEHRNEIQKQILELAHLYDGCAFVISSRFDDRFASWQNFYVYQALAFRRDQTAQVIEKAKFDQETKKEFIKNIFEKRYEEYKGFFATPLLTLMMMMTYLQIRHIPDHVHIFYRYAFQTLFTLHDASKQGFQRKRRLKLSEQEFAEIFATFCISTYADMEHTFSEEDCLRYLEKVRIRLNKDFKTKDFLIDATESVNLLFKDGDQYSFIHRSFQEYFTAYAITHYFITSMQEVLRRIPLRESDSVYAMCHSMNSNLVDEMYVVPEFEKHVATFAKISREKHPFKILAAADYTAEFGFVLGNREYFSQFYNTEGESDFSKYVTSVYLMFKELFPRQLRSNIRAAGLMKTRRVLENFVRNEGNLRAGQQYVANAEFDFEARRIRFEVFPRDTSLDEPRTFTIELDDETSRKQFPYIEFEAEKLKLRAALVKRKVDEIKRNLRRSRGTADDILAL